MVTGHRTCLVLGFITVPEMGLTLWVLTSAEGGMIVLCCLDHCHTNVYVLPGGSLLKLTEFRNG